MRTIFAVLLALPVFAGDNLLVNGDLSEWKDGVPAGWKGFRGAGVPGGPESKIEKSDDGGVRLSGDAATKTWRVLSQDIVSKEEGYFRLTFEARVAGLKNEPGQYDDAWVGLFGLGDGAEPLTRAYEHVTSEKWAPFELLLPDSKTPVVRASIFLSKTGRIEARNFSLEKLTAGDSAAVLLAEIGRRYSHFEDKHLEWPAIEKRHREALEKAADAAAFASAAKDLLAEFNDVHTWVQRAGRAKDYPFTPKTRPNFDLKVVLGNLKGAVRIGKEAVAGLTADGFGYVVIGSLAIDDATAVKIIAEIDLRLDAPGFIVDLRANSGGKEVVAQSIAAIFADRERVYALQRFRNGPAPGDFGPTGERKITPRAGKTFTGPVVVLTGPACISSGECFVMAMKTFLHVTLVGLPTAGMNGNPMPVELPNGVAVSFSRWINLLPDGTPTEGKGIAPDVEVKQEGDGDAAFEKAVEILKEKTKK